MELPTRSWKAQSMFAYNTAAVSLLTLNLHHIWCTDSQGVYSKSSLFCMYHAMQNAFAMTVCLTFGAQEPDDIFLLLQLDQCPDDPDKCTGLGSILTS